MPPRKEAIWRMLPNDHRAWGWGELQRSLDAHHGFLDWLVLVIIVNLVRGSRAGLSAGQDSAKGHLNLNFQRPKRKRV